MRLRMTSLMLLSSLFITSCATIISGTTQQVTFQSTPDEATIRLNGRPLGKTPLTIRLDKKTGQTLTIEKDGYRTFTTSMDTTLDPWFWGNIVIGGLLGSTTDGISGSIHEYSPGKYFVTLEPKSSSQLDSNIHLSQKESARQFLFVNYRHLKKDLSQNSGEFIEATVDMLGIPKHERPTAIRDIRQIMFTHNDPADFVTITINKYLG